MRRIVAIALLAFHFWKHIFLKVTFLYRAGGEERFVGNYRPDRVLPVPARVRANLPEWHSCVGCGLCDAVGPTSDISVMSLVGSGLRDFTMREDVAAEAAAVLEAGPTAKMEAICPTSVPIGDVLRYLATGE
ncbi:MAG: ferredoxin [Bradymonadia bacterium]|jgi:ferredoxin